MIIYPVSIDEIIESLRKEIEKLKTFSVTQPSKIEKVTVAVEPGKIKTHLTRQIAIVEAALIPVTVPPAAMVGGEEIASAWADIKAFIEGW